MTPSIGCSQQFHPNLSDNIDATGRAKNNLPSTPQEKDASGSPYLNGLTSDQRKDLEKQLHGSQNGNCFVCGKPIDLTLDANAIDVDHVEPLKIGRKDDPKNFALTHSSCNRSKQASNLRVTRVLAQFEQIRDAASTENRGPNLSDVLARFGGAKHELCMKLEGSIVKYSLPEIGSNEVQSVPLYNDQLSGSRYFFAKLPIPFSRR